MKYSIVIPTHNHLEDCLKPCLESIIKNTHRLLSSGQAEVVVVCNGCTDGSEAWLESQKTRLSTGAQGGSDWLRIVSSKEKLGYTKATNVGIMAASTDSEYFILMNNDCVILDWGAQGHWIEIMRWALDRDPMVAVAGPKKISAKDTGHPDKSFVVFFLAMIPKRLMWEIGLLDEAFSPGGGEDIDWCFRAQARGYKTVSVPEDVVAVETSGTTYPIWHKGEVTVHDGVSVGREEWEAGFWERMAMVGRRVSSGYYGFPRDEQSEPVSSDDGKQRMRRRLNDIGRSLDSMISAAEKSGEFQPEFDTLMSELRIFKDALNKDNEHTQEGEYAQYLIEEGEKHRTRIDGPPDSVIAPPFGVSGSKEFVEERSERHESARSKAEAMDALVERLNTAHGKFFGFSESHVSAYENDESVSKDRREYASYLREAAAKWRLVNVLVDVCTRDRYETSLPACLMSVMSQTVLPRRVRVYCDDPMRFSEVISRICRVAESKGVQIHITQGSGRGQAWGHEEARKLAVEEGFDYVWRIDDDNFAEPDTLGKLLSEIKSDPDIGAVGGSVPDPNAPAPDGASTRIEDIFSGNNLQWCAGTGTVDADHLYSTFLYRADCAPQYRLDLSRIGHREETFFTYGMRLLGKRLRIVRDAITWHLRASSGGLRAETDHKLWESDELKFREWLQDVMALGVDPADLRRAVTLEAPKATVRFNMNFGMGDHIMALRALGRVAPRLRDKKCVFYVCHHAAFDDYWRRLAEEEGISDWEIKSVGDGQAEMGQKGFDEISVYWWMMWHNWTGHAIDAMEKCYVEQIEKAESSCVDGNHKTAVV